MEKLCFEDEETIINLDTKDCGAEGVGGGAEDAWVRRRERGVGRRVRGCGAEGATGGAEDAWVRWRMRG